MAEQQLYDQLLNARQKNGDALEAWLRLISWSEENCDSLPPNHLRFLLELCIRELQQNQSYLQDERFLSLFQKYASLSRHLGAEKIYEHLAAQRMFTTLSKFYVIWAQALEARGKVIEATRVFRMAQEAQAQPVDQLQSAYREFLARNSADEEEHTCAFISAFVSRPPVSKKAEASETIRRQGRQRSTSGAVRLSNTDGMNESLPTRSGMSGTTDQYEPAIVCLDQISIDGKEVSLEERRAERMFRRSYSHLKISDPPICRDLLDGHFPDQQFARPFLWEDEVKRMLPSKTPSFTTSFTTDNVKKAMAAYEETLQFSMWSGTGGNCAVRNESGNLSVALPDAVDAPAAMTPKARMTTAFEVFDEVHHCDEGDEKENVYIPSSVSRCPTAGFLAKREESTTAAKVSVSDGRSRSFGLRSSVSEGSLRKSTIEARPSNVSRGPRRSRLITDEADVSKPSAASHIPHCSLSATADRALTTPRLDVVAFDVENAAPFGSSNEASICVSSGLKPHPLLSLSKRTQVIARDSSFSGGSQ